MTWSVWILAFLLGQGGGVEALPEREEISEELLEELEALRAAPLNPNTAPPYELYSIPFLSPDQVARILDLREEAPFSSWEDLQRRIGLDPVTAGLLKGVFTFPPHHFFRGRLYGRAERRPREQRVSLAISVRQDESLRIGIRGSWREKEEPNLRLALIWMPRSTKLQGIGIGHLTPLFGLGLLQGYPAFFSGFRPPPGPSPGFLRGQRAPGIWAAWTEPFPSIQVVASPSQWACQLGFPVSIGEIGLTGRSKGISLWGHLNGPSGTTAFELAQYRGTWSGVLTFRRAVSGAKVEAAFLLRGAHLPLSSRYTSLAPGRYLSFALQGQGPGGWGFRVIRTAEVKSHPDRGLFRSWRGSYLLIRRLGALHLSLGLRDGGSQASPRPQVWILRMEGGEDQHHIRCELHRSGESFALSGQLRQGSWTFFVHVFSSQTQSLMIFEPDLPGFPRRIWLSGQGHRTGIRVKGRIGGLIWAFKGTETYRNGITEREIRLMLSIPFAFSLPSAAVFGSPSLSLPSFHSSSRAR